MDAGWYRLDDAYEDAVSALIYSPSRVILDSFAVRCKIHIQLHPFFSTLQLCGSSTASSFFAQAAPLNAAPLLLSANSTNTEVVPGRYIITLDPASVTLRHNKVREIHSRNLARRNVNDYEEPGEGVGKTSTNSLHYHSVRRSKEDKPQPVRFFDTAGSYASQTLDGFQWAANDMVAKGRTDTAVINMSLGGGASSAIDRTVAAAYVQRIMSVGTASRRRECHLPCYGTSLGAVRLPMQHRCTPQGRNAGQKRRKLSSRSPCQTEPELRLSLQRV
jgi:hypothetical protein